MAGNRIARTKTIDGVVTPAFIHNFAYHFTNLHVYADGLVHCWEMLDLPLFRAKLESGWVATEVPDGEPIAVHGLGRWTVAQGRWPITEDAMFARVTELVRELNPRMENLHDCHGRTTEKLGKGNVAIIPLPPEQPVRVREPGPFAKRIAGDNVQVFVRGDGAQYLADLRAFADGVIEIGRLPTAETLDLPRLEQAVLDGRVCSSAPAGTRVEIHGLGGFTVLDEQWSVDILEILRGVPDLIDAANGRPDSVARCRAAHEAYLADPTEAHRDALRVAYEAIPAHQRIYVGDMDTKDSRVRTIIYGRRD